MSVRALLERRLLICPLVIVQNLQAVFFYAETFIRKWQGHPLITPILAPHAPNTTHQKCWQKLLNLVGDTSSCDHARC